ncbi:MAG: HEAT repeat domain-containing protein [Verrucomicrobiales bacterium]|nr:HEAT repeat domain-containing protein [Verrucomicrobiales bacterium]
MRDSICGLASSSARRLVIALLILIGWLTVHAHEFACAHARRLAAAPDSADARKYAPDRLVDIRHVLIDLTPDFKARTIAAQTTLRFQPIAKPLRELKLDAVDLRITQVESTAPIQGWQNTDRHLIVTFQADLPPSAEVGLTIRYTAEPTEGLFFRTPEMGYPAGDTHLFTQGEPISHRHWFPCFDAPNEKFTSETICRVPEGMTVVSNGRRVSQEKDPATGLTAFRWLQDKPHVNYLIALVAGNFEKLEARHRDIELTFLTPPSEFQWATSSFADTPAMMAYLEEEIGVPYPWAKYAQACVHDFVAGGMENTSLTILTMGTLFPPETGNIRSSQGLVVHELVHQWFGDLVTCKDWSHLWLNEGFATYFEALFDGHKNGRDHLLYNLWEKAQSVLSVENDITPIVWRDFGHPDDQFSFRAYPKGAWVLHMLRSQLGADLFRRCVKTWLERHAYGVVVTEDLNSVIEELSGRSFDPFFDQWVYHAGVPELEITYTWEEQTRLARLSVRQTHTVSDKVRLFRFPLPVRFTTPAGVVDRTLNVEARAEDFYVALPAKPTRLRVDPEYTVLAKMRVELPNDLLHAQLENPDDCLGRLLAVTTLSGRKDQDTIDRLKKRLNEDVFHGVRIEASKALRSAHSDEALEALLASTRQPDDRVRQQVYEDLGAFYRESALQSAQAAIDGEPNPDVQAPLIRSLAAYASPKTRAILLRLLGTDSFRNAVADAAIDSMRGQDDPAYIAPLLETLRTREAVFTTYGYARAMKALAWLARHEENRDGVREFLASKLDHPKPSVRRDAIEALGTLGDPKALAKIETFTRDGRDSPERAAAEAAVSTLRASKPPAENLHDLRNEVLVMQKENRELKKEFESLRKKLEELQGAKAEPPKPGEIQP